MVFNIVLTEMISRSSGTAHITTISARGYHSGQSFLRDV